MSTDNDFVARLRIRWDAMGDTANDERAAAATEIESLRSSQREMMRTIATLRTERDEARIKLCRLDAEARSQNARIFGFSDHYYSPKQIANERGWDCFKEGT